MLKPKLENRDGAVIVRSRCGLETACRFIEDVTAADAQGYGCVIIDDDDDAASKKSTKSCIDITGLALLSKSEFWQLWVLMGLLTGVGLMTIKYVSSESCVSSSLISTATLVTMSRLSGNTGMTRSRTISSLIDNFGTSR